MTRGEPPVPFIGAGGFFGFWSVTMGGKPNPGTKKDKRLSVNRPAPVRKPSTTKTVQPRRK